MSSKRGQPNEVHIYGDLAYLITTDRYGRRKVGTVIDAEDVERVLGIGHRWSSAFLDGKWRINTTEAPGYITALPRFLLSAPDRTIVDHINRNTLDNRKSNLRIVTHGQNMHNRPPSRRSKTGDKNVYFDKTQGKYVVSMMVNRRRMFFGSYIELDEAKKVAVAARLHHQPHCID